MRFESPPSLLVRALSLYQLVTKPLSLLLLAKLAFWPALAFSTTTAGCKRQGSGASPAADASTSSQDGGGRDGSTNDPDGGPNLCGNGACEASETGLSCPADCLPCAGLTEEGCCNGDTLFWCDEDTRRFDICGEAGCGWSDESGTYLCGGVGEGPPDAPLRSCGCQNTKMSTSRRVYNGTPSPTAVCMTPGQILAVGALATQEGMSYSNFCTATLISDDLVLTAAHCVSDAWGSGTRDPDEVFFVVGVDVNTPVHVFSVASLHKHPNYEWEADHDVGLVVLDESATQMVPEIQPIPINTVALPGQFVGEIVQNVGYGATHDDDLNTRRWWTEEPVTDLAAGEFTVYGNGWSSVCYGDSGGPSLYAFDEQKLRVIGTVSWGDPSCMDYDHFARVDDNTSFIASFSGGWDPCATLGEAGACIDSVAQWCENGELHQQCCEEACGLDGDGNHRCLSSAPPCGDIDELGVCREDELVWCREGQPVRRFCNVCGGQTCGWVDETIGHACVDR